MVALWTQSMALVHEWREICLLIYFIRHIIQLLWLWVTLAIKTTSTWHSIIQDNLTETFTKHITQHMLVMTTAFAVNDKLTDQYQLDGKSDTSGSCEWKFSKPWSYPCITVIKVKRRDCLRAGELPHWTIHNKPLKIQGTQILSTAPPCPPLPKRPESQQTDSKLTYKEWPHWGQERCLNSIQGQSQQTELPSLLCHSWLCLLRLNPIRHPLTWCRDKHRIGKVASIVAKLR